MSFDYAMNTMLPTTDNGDITHITGVFGEQRATGPHKVIFFNWLVL